VSKTITRRGALPQSLSASVVAVFLALPMLAGADPVVVRGAEWVSPPSVPAVKTVDMQRLPPAPEWKPGDPIKSIPRLMFGDPNTPVPVPVNPVFGHDALVERQINFRSRLPTAFGTPIVNQNVLSGTAQPNDPTGDIGTHQFVAAINGPGGGQFAAYDKVTGAQVVAPTLMESLGSGGLCAAGLGDPIVLFDELASRWVLTEFSSSGNGLCVYLSDVADLSGTVTWTRYLFTLPSFPDYPKYGVWPNAYFVGANEGGTTGRRPFYAMDRQKMLAGEPATLQRLTIANLAGFNFQMTQPADLAGTDAPPADAPGIFMRHRDDEAHNAGSNDPNADFIELFEFSVDWTTPANSAITGPITFTVSEFSSNLNGLTAFQAFPQPSGQRLDPLRETVMHRLTYRRLPDYEVLVGNYVTDLFLGAGSIYPNDTGAVRWFELRRPLGPPDGFFANGFEGNDTQPEGAVASWTLHQEGTFAPEDTLGTPAEQGDRWMAASSVDASGNIALAYNHVRQTPAISAGLRYTGRLASDPLGVMSAGENPIVAGSSSVTGERWGDYNDMGIDPVDGCTFWFVGNYSNSGARSNRAASFKFDECGGASFTLTSPAPSVSVCANSASPGNATPITLNAASVNGFVGAVDLSFPNPFASGIAGTFAPTTIPSLPGSSIAQLTATNAATPGTSNIVARGTSGAIVRNLQLSLTVATGNPATPTLVAPADNASGVGATPTFTWTAAAQAVNYLVEASTSAGFGTTLFSQTVTGTSLVSPVALPTNQQIFWRVTADNVCGGTTSVVYSYNGPTFTMATTTPSVSLCANSAAPVSAPPITLDLEPVNGFVGSVAMSYPNAFPTGIAGTLTPNPVPSVPGTTTAQLTATNATTPGAAIIVARGVAGLTTRDVSLTLNVSTATPGAPTLTAPANAASNVTVVPTFNWAAAAQATSYVVEASTSNTFGTTLFSQTVSGTSLVSPVAMPPDTEIFWRVRPANICGDGSNSAVFSFTTANVQEFCRDGLNVAIPDNNLAGVSDNLTISGVSGNVGDLDVRVELTHTYVGDLRLRLARATPAATVNLMSNPTNNPSGACSGDNLNALFDDDVAPARPAQSACAAGAVPTYAGTVTPQQATSAFDGQSANSTWTLTVIDSAGVDVGTLTRWCIILN
jgi:subtilisin-like proprotein convertase family protein